MSNTPLLDKIKNPKDLKKLEASQLKTLCNELRQDTINIVSQIGGHLGASLGVVELTTALHYVFNTPKDKVIWDVGHQAYPHKILTERRGKMLTLRQKGGLAGFTKRAESEYDPFGAGHSSTSISAALGFAISNPKEKAIAVIGDGAMSAGMAYEAINNAGHLKAKNLIIILNDNDMSIARPTGALSSYLAKLISSNSYRTIKNYTSDLLKQFPAPINKTIKIAKKRAKELMNDALSGNNLFENLGVSYLGPIDGHNIDELVKILTSIRNAEFTKPVLLHLVTKKGYGYEPAENSNDKYHGVAKFDIKTGEQQKKKTNASYTKIFSDTLIEITKKDKKIRAITAAMPDGTGLDKFAEKYPKLTFDVGIAEQHAVTFAGGLAAGGLKPFVAIYSTFLQRAYDQIIHDVAIQNLPVRFAIDRAGLVGADGPTHAGSFDLAYLCCLPNMVVMAASSDQELVDMTYTASLHDKSPIAFRYPRGIGLGEKLRAPKRLTIGKAKEIQKGKDILILSLGTRLQEVIKACQTLKVKPTIIDMRFAKPIDTKIIDKHIKTHKKLITIEEGSIGGFSAQVNHHLNETGQNKNLKIKNLILPDTYINQQSPEEIYKEAGLDSETITKTLKQL